MNTDTHRKDTTATGILLWLVLAAAAVVNLLSSVAGLGMLIQIAAGAVVLVCAGLLVGRYRRRGAGGDN